MLQLVGKWYGQLASYQKQLKSTMPYVMRSANQILDSPTFVVLLLRSFLSNW